MTHVLFYHRRSGTYLVGDLIQEHNQDDLNSLKTSDHQGHQVLCSKSSAPRDYGG